MQVEIENLCEAASFPARGYAFGSTGNLSVSDGTRVWISPTGASLRRLTPGRMAEIDMDGVALNGNRASEEYPFHLAAYRNSFSAAPLAVIPYLRPGSAELGGTMDEAVERAEIARISGRK